MKNINLKNVFKKNTNKLEMLYWQLPEIKKNNIKPKAHVKITLKYIKII